MSIVLPNLGLIAWDDETDEFEHSVLADNFVSIDNHDHEGGLSEGLEPPEGPESELPAGAHWTSLGLGKPIGTRAINPGAIWRYLIALNAVGHLQIGPQEVWSRNIKDLNVENKHVANEAIDNRTIEEHTITIDKLDPNILTLGSIILWYKWSVGAKPGDLWAVMDGTVWSDIPNDMGLTEGRIPDTREKFIRGSEESKSDGKETGGNPSVNLTHTHTLSSARLEHTHVISGHTHGIAGAGFHNHTFAGGYKMHTRQNAFVNGLTIQDFSTKEVHRNLLQSTYIQAPQFDHDNEFIPGYDEEVLMDESGFHTHGGGNTNLSAAFNSSGSSLGEGTTIETSAGLEHVETTPPYIGFVHIMLVRNTGT